MNILTVVFIRIQSCVFLVNLGIGNTNKSSLKPRFGKVKKLLTY